MFDYDRIFEQDNGMGGSLYFNILTFLLCRRMKHLANFYRPINYTTQATVDIEKAIVEYNRITTFLVANCLENISRTMCKYKVYMQY